MSIKLSEANLLKYFWEEKGDFTRHTSFDDISAQLKEEYPMLFEGINRIKQGENMVEYTLDKIVEESEDDLNEDYL